MVIDLILDKKDYDEFLKKNKITNKEYVDYYNKLNKKEQIFSITPYDTEKFYKDVLEYYQIFNMETIENILNALDNGTEKDVKNAICNYIIKLGYNKKICNYVNQTKWL